MSTTLLPTTWRVEGCPSSIPIALSPVTNAIEGPTSLLCYLLQQIAFQFQIDKAMALRHRSCLRLIQPPPFLLYTTGREGKSLAARSFSRLPGGMRLLRCEGDLFNTVYTPCWRLKFKTHPQIVRAPTGGRSVAVDLTRATSCGIMFHDNEYYSII
jgi:hypothetical protein